MKVEKAFDLLASHLEARKDAVKFLATSASIEGWVQFELAALIHENRKKLGITGSDGNGQPAWWVTCEHQKRDLWISGPGGDYLIELKAIHNNKNFRDRIKSIRYDFNPERLQDAAARKAEKWSIAIATHAVYATGYGDLYPVRGGRQRPTSAKVVWDEFEQLLADGSRAWMAHGPRMEIVRRREVTTLKDAPYVDRANDESRVVLYLLRPAEQ